MRRRARRVICVSEFTREQAVRLGGIDSQRTSVVHLGVDPAWTAGAGSRNVSTSPYLVFVGLVKPHKNLLGLLRAFEILMAAIPHRLVVVGRHTSVRDVDRAALDLARRLGSRVELLENVPRARLIQVVAGADLLVQPSFHEGFGLPPLEAMAAGTPVPPRAPGRCPRFATTPLSIVIRACEHRRIDSTNRRRSLAAPLNERAWPRTRTCLHLGRLC
jgi:glycosyltransferase involved in cell wall biosynthesis